MTYLLLYNPVSGKGKATKKVIKTKQLFEQRGVFIDVYESQCQGDLEHIAFLKAPIYDCFIIAGGDGTINEVINGVMKSEKKPKIAVIAGGTANDISCILGMPKRLNKFVDMILTGETVLMDVNQLNERYFVYATAAGILTNISYATPRKQLKRFGYIAYLWYGVKDFFKTYKLKLRIEHDHGVLEGDYMLVLGLSAKRVGGLSLRRFSKGKLNDGLLELRLVKYSKFNKLFKLMFFFLFAGRKSRSDVHLSSSYYMISHETKVEWNTDGENMDCNFAEMKVVPKALEVYVSERSKKRYF